MKTPRIYVIGGVSPIDDIFSITLVTGEFVGWNITRLNAAARRGEFGPPRYAPVADLPPAKWSSWGDEDRATVDWLKAPENRKVLDEPAIAIASPNPSFAISCFADGQHRITARQELELPEFSFYLVPL